MQVEDRADLRVVKLGFSQNSLASGRLLTGLSMHDVPDQMRIQGEGPWRSPRVPLCSTHEASAHGADHEFYLFKILLPPNCNLSTCNV